MINWKVEIKEDIAENSFIIKISLKTRQTGYLPGLFHFVVTFK